VNELDRIACALETIADALSSKTPPSTAPWLALAIHAHAGEGVFTVGDLLLAAQAESDLRDAIIDEIGSLNPRRLGKLLARIEGEIHEENGLAVVRVGASNSVLWGVRSVSSVCHSGKRNTLA
jgi:hypothetical protein